MARRRRKAGSSSSGPAVIVGAVVLLVVAALPALVRWVTENWVPLTIVAGVVAIVIVFGVVQGVRARRAADARRAAREREIASTDGMTGPQFEQWMARLLRRTGFRDVTVLGGAGDLGADIIARAPDGRRTVIQCKRHSRNVSSSDMQKFAGTCRTIHKAELAVFVTTAGFSRPARDLAARLDIVAIDRELLSAWAWEQRPPAVLSEDPPRSPAA